MSWIQENKFTAGVLGAAVVVSGVLFYTGYSARSEAKEIREASNSAISEMNTLKSKVPFPSAENKDLVEAKVASFTDEALVFQDSLLAFRPSEFVSLSESAFATKVSAHRQKLVEYYKEQGVALHDGGKDVTFGLELYSGGNLARKDATSLLEYKRNALEWLFTKLADAGPDSLDNIYRTPMVEELKPVVDNTKKKSKKKTKKGAKTSSKLESVYRAMPIELTFTGSEVSLKEFLMELSNAKDYFYITRSVRIRNLNNESPNLSDAEFETAPAIIDGFGGGLLDGETELPEPAATKIIKQVTGNEKVKVHLKLDLVLFDEASAVVFPGAKKKMKKEMMDKPEKEMVKDSEVAPK